MIKLFGPINSGVSTGGAGTSTANADSTTRLKGKMLSIYVKYNDSPPAGTTDVIVKTKGTSPAAPTRTFLTLTNAATDGWKDPRVIPHDTAGVALAALAIAEPIPFDDFINVSIAQADDGDSVDVWLLIED